MRSSESPYRGAVSMWLIPYRSSSSSARSASAWLARASAAAPKTVTVLRWPLRPKGRRSINVSPPGRLAASMDAINHGPKPRFLAVLLVLALCAPALASDTGLSGGEGHPRARFPLTVHAQPLGEPRLDAAVRRAVDDWNAVAEETLGFRAFAW